MGLRDEGSGFGEPTRFDTTGGKNDSVSTTGAAEIGHRWRGWHVQVGVEVQMLMPMRLVPTCTCIAQLDKL